MLKKTPDKKNRKKTKSQLHANKNSREITKYRSIIQKCTHKIKFDEFSIKIRHNIRSKIHSVVRIFKHSYTITHSKHDLHTTQPKTRKRSTKKFNEAKTTNRITNFFLNIIFVDKIS